MRGIAWISVMIAIGGLLIGTIVLSSFLSFAQGIQSFQEPRIMGVLEFYNTGNTSSARYIAPSFSNFFSAGDLVELHGHLMQVGDWDSPLNATANVKIEGPDGSIVYEKRNIATNMQNNFQISVPITPAFAVGEYVASVEPIKTGYVVADNQYLTPFYIFRNNTHTITDQNSQTYSIFIGSIQFESENLHFDEKTRELNFDVRKVHGTYASDGDPDYAGRFLFVIIEKPLLQGTLQYRLDGNELVYWPSTQQNEKSFVSQFYADDIKDKASFTVWATP